MSAVVAGMNRYRAWIDGGEFRLLFACQFLSAIVFITLYLGVTGAVEGWAWAMATAGVLLPVDVYLGVAQMTGWRWNGLGGEKP